GATVREEHLRTRAEFVSLGVSAKVIMIIENQDAGFRLLRTPKISSRQATNSSPDDDEIVRFACIDRLAGGFPEIAVAHIVSSLKGADVAPAKARESGRIVAGLILRSAFVSGVCPNQAW